MTIPQFVAGSVLEAAQLNVLVNALNAGGGKMEVQQFTASGTFTVPAGVTHAVAHIRAGGGGVGQSGTGAGGTSSVAFASGTISAAGGPALAPSAATLTAADSFAGAANSGNGATFFGVSSNSNFGGLGSSNGAEIVAGGAVTPAEDIAITVGAGGVAGTNGAAGGSGYVWIEYQV